MPDQPTIEEPAIRTPPKGGAILLIVGPSLVWTAEYIGSGEVVIATRTGAVLGTSVLWAVAIRIFLKFWIGVGLYVVMPKLFSDAAREVVCPHWIFAAGLALAFLVFGYFCLFQMPYVF